MGFLEEIAALDGKVAVVTGGAGGLGRAITLDLARAGLSVALCDRDAVAIEQITPMLRDIGRPFYTECFDVRNSDALTAFFANVDAQFPKLDVLVTVPGGSFQAPIVDIAPKGVDAVMRQNFTSVLEASQHAARRMTAGGSMIYVSTIEAHRAMPTMGIYGAMKAGIAHLAQTLALELGPQGIRINTVAPDMFPNDSSDTTGLRDTSAPEYDELNQRISIPMARFGTGRDLAGVVLFLASDLSVYVTGTTIHVDGGTKAAAGWMHWPEGYRNLVPTRLLPHV